jgi:hypothetical protein
MITWYRDVWPPVGVCVAETVLGGVNNRSFGALACHKLLYDAPLQRPRFSLCPHKQGTFFLALSVSEWSMALSLFKRWDCVIDAQQARMYNIYKNTRLELLKSNAAIWFNKICRERHLKMYYRRCIITNTSFTDMLPHHFNQCFTTIFKF